MSVLLPVNWTARRHALASGSSLTLIADGLSRELEPLLHAALPIPAQKARLTRAGGRCPVHRTLLEFNPWTPHEHVCLACNTGYHGREHDDWWAMGAQLWTVERAVHAAALYALRGDVRHLALAERILTTLSAQYTSWPNRDNVLGPSRPFFSTYLESIWLLNAAHALAILEAVGPTSCGASVRARLLEPSSALIAGYHERRSNRQVWNEVAILSAWTLLGRTAQAEARCVAPGSLCTLMQDGLLADGSWYEGENYHQFAHRGLWYGVQLMRAIGVPLSPTLHQRFLDGFLTPFAGVLPDDTLPSRRDSQYAVSIRQWRYAEWCELAYAARPDARVAGLLSRLYDGSVTRLDQSRAHSTADAERNGPASALARGACSWRALLMANEAAVPAGEWTPSSVLQPAQGLAIVRREHGAVYVALEGGVTGGEHGHPDRLALTLQTAHTRWLDDPGTGSYVERTLHWYRSTMAHHAPLINGASQDRRPATLLAFEDRGGAGWIQKQVKDLAPGVTATRTVVVGDTYLVDMLELSAPHPVTVTVPVAGAATIPNVQRWCAATRPGQGGLEDGFDFLAQVEEATDTPEVVVLHAIAPNATTGPAYTAHGWYTASSPITLWRALAPAAPGADPAAAMVPRHAIDMHAASGRLVGVWSWARQSPSTMHAHDTSLLHTAGAVQVSVNAHQHPYAVITTPDGTTAAHQPAEHGWHIDLVARHARSSIDLERHVPASPAPTPSEPPPVTEPPVIVRVPRVDDACANADVLGPLAGAHTTVLAAQHYVPTEVPWGGSNAPVAHVSLACTDTTVVVRVHVTTGHPTSRPPGQHSVADMPENPLDNERADINADGLQCYIGVAADPSASWRAAVLAIPASATEPRVTSLVPNGPVPQVRCADRADGTGWAMQLTWRRDTLPMELLAPHALRFDLVVNERAPDRARRGGQLVLSGGEGFGYLRGDRHTTGTAWVLQFP